MLHTAKKSAGILAAAIMAGSAGLMPAAAAPPASAESGQYFERTATYPVYQNHPQGESAVSAAEISTVSADGKTLVYTDALARQVGFVDISDVAHPKGLGSLPLHQLGSAEDEPTSVVAFDEYVFVVVNTSESYSNPSGRVDVVRIADRSLVRSIKLSGQPDSIALSPDGKYAAIAIENERDEDAGDGGLPQAPAGAVAILDLIGKTPADWSLREVPLTGGTAAKPVALDVLKKAGLDTPEDPEPEYVAINAKNQVAVTLQENNGVVVIDLSSGRIKKAFSTGSVDLDGVDTKDDGKLDPTGSLRGVPREPDAIAWIQDKYLATANEGDWKGGSHGFTVFNANSGKPVWDAGNSLEQIALSQGLFPEKRAGKKGIEPEGLAVAKFNGVDYAFVASERGNFVAVYDMGNPKQPKYLQTLPTTNGPEGVLPIPQRNLLAVSSETDEAENGVRSSINLFAFGADKPQFPTLSSRGDKLVPFGALSGLSRDLDHPEMLFAVSDSAYEPMIYSIDAAGGTVEQSMPVTDQGKAAELDLEGISHREDGGFWAVSEGKKGPENKLVRIDGAGAVQQEVALPAEIAGKLGKQGLEGVASYGSGASEEVVFILQREAEGEDFVRIGKYLPASGEFNWYGYRLEAPANERTWNGLSEITRLSDGSFAVIERDNAVGEHAQLKAVYQFQLPEASSERVQMLEKKLAIDVLPVLEQGHGRTQEKLEGLAVAGNSQVYVVTDNDGVDDATGETVFAALGTESEVFNLGGQRAVPSDEAEESSASAAPKAEASFSAEPAAQIRPQRSGEPEPAAQAESATEAAGLADTGVNSLWLLPVGLLVAVLGSAAAVKSKRARKG